ncbi:hypothetical protein Tco_0075796, partial [Tanacetum coccineum]
MAVDVEEVPEQEEEVEDNFKELPLKEKLRIKTSIQDPPTDLEMKPLPKHLEYAYLEKDSLLPVVISALLKDDKNKRLVSILKKHKKHYCSDDQYAVSIKEDTAYLCLHSPKDHEGNKTNTPYLGKAIRRIQCYIGIKYSRRFQTWTLLQETPNTPYP